MDGINNFFIFCYCDKNIMIILIYDIGEMKKIRKDKFWNLVIFLIIKKFYEYLVFGDKLFFL